MNADNSFEFNPQFTSTRNDFQGNSSGDQRGGRGRRGSFRRRASFEEEEIDVNTRELWRVTFTYEKQENTYEDSD